MPRCEYCDQYYTVYDQTIINECVPKYYRSGKAAGGEHDIIFCNDECRQKHLEKWPFLRTYMR